MHFVARIQPSLDFLTRFSTLLMRMPSEGKDNDGGKVRVRGRGGEMKSRRDSKKDDIEVLGLANVATECFAHSKSMSTLVSGLG